MNRIDRLFQQGKKEVLSIYFTAGFPQLEDTVPIIETLEQSGADIIEIGMPFSDPLADGPVIQKSSQVALKNGMNLQVLFNQLKNIREKVDIPLILMGYLNPVMQFGVERFIKKCAEAGIDGLILPDLPLTEFEEHYQKLFEENGLHNIFLITPQTPDKRIQLLDKASKGFLYALSTSSTTGTKKGMDEGKEEYLRKLKQLDLENPVMIGFGISDRPSFVKACEYADGAIIGSAFIKALQQEGDLKNHIQTFVHNIKNPAK